MKKSYETEELMIGRDTRRYRVLAKGSKPFDTDSLSEAIIDAEIKAVASDFVSVLDDGRIVAQWLGHRRAQRLPFPPKS